MTFSKLKIDDTNFWCSKDQNYRCTECPARCCRLPWSIPVSTEEKAFLETADATAARLRERNKSFKKNKKGNYVLPFYEHDKFLQCVFLDTDGLCLVQKTFGHDKLPWICQAYPFDFITDDSGDIKVCLSKVCPSIRDNYGDPIEQNLFSKFAQAKRKAQPIPQGIYLGRKWLKQKSYLKLSNICIEILRSEKYVPDALIKMHSLVTTLEVVLKNDEHEDIAALANKLLANYNASCWNNWEKRTNYESVIQSISGVEIAKTVFQLLNRFGQVDILLIPGALDLNSIKSLYFDWDKKDIHNTVCNYLICLLERGSLYIHQKNFLNIVFSLAIASSLLTILSRAYSAAENKQEVDSSSVQKATSIVDLRLYHSNLNYDSKIADFIIGLLARNKNSFIRLATGASR